MTKIPYTIAKTTPYGTASAAIVLPDEDPATALIESIWQDIGLDVIVTIGAVTMPAAMWEYPDHWSEDWAEKLECDSAEAPERVAALLADAMVATS